MARCFFVSDLHGKVDRYEKLFRLIAKEKPNAVFIGGDIFPGFHHYHHENDFVKDFLLPNLKHLRSILESQYPRIFIILGNDDPRCEEDGILEVEQMGFWQYIHNRRVEFDRWKVFGYSFVPPTPFLLKDWERYDVSRYIDPGCIPPEEGRFTVEMSKREIIYSTIREDLQKLTSGENPENSIFLFHSPPYNTELDRADLDDVRIDGVPADVHVGSIAIRQFIETFQPLLTLHGHVHESAMLTGSWRSRIGRTYMFSAAHRGSDLAIVRFDPEDLDRATRQLV